MANSDPDSHEAGKKKKLDNTDGKSAFGYLEQLGTGKVEVILPSFFSFLPFVPFVSSFSFYFFCTSLVEILLKIKCHVCILWYNIVRQAYSFHYKHSYRMLFLFAFGSV